MKLNRKKINRMVLFLLVMIFLAFPVTMQCSAAQIEQGAKEDVIIITPEEDMGEEIGEEEAEKDVIAEPEEPQEESADETEEEPEEPIEEPEPIELKQPASFEATAVKDGIRLTWKEVPKAQKYEVYCKKAGEEAYTQIKVTKKCAYTDKSAEYGVTYIYKVRAIAVSDGKTYKSACSSKKKCKTYRVDPSKPMVALTFDDGPSQYTPGILDSLEKNQSRATFFEVGNRVNQYRDIVLRVSQLGCEIGNHSYDHALLGSASASKIRSELSTTDAKIKAITGKTPVLFRPPYGSIGRSLRQNAGKPMVLWSIDTLDWKSRNADKVYESVMRQVSDGDIILMHDLYSFSREAAKRLIPELKKRGYQLVTVSELAQYRNVKLADGECYSQMRPKKN